jgi:hypothetical protein
VSSAAVRPPELMAPNPCDTKQLANYRNTNRYESTKRIWTLNLDLTAVYAIKAEATLTARIYAF